MQRMALWGGAGVAIVLGIALATSGCGKSPTNPIGDSRARIIVFASDRNATPGQFDLYLYDLDGLRNTLSPFVNSITAADLHPTATPNGGTVAFESTRSGGAGGSDLYFYDRGRNQYVAVGNVNTAADETEPFFTHSGRRLAFTQTAGGFRQVRLLEGSSDTLIALPGLNTPTSNNQSSSPDENGNKIAFVSDRNGNPDVFIYDATGDSLLALPDLVSDSTDTDPWITPDGHFLLFASTRTGGVGGLDLYLYDLTTQAFVTLAASVNTAQTEQHPAMSPDADFITFQSDRAASLNGSLDLWVHSRSGGGTAQPVGLSSPASDIQPFLVWPR